MCHAATPQVYFCWQHAWGQPAQVKGRLASLGSKGLHTCLGQRISVAIPPLLAFLSYALSCVGPVPSQAFNSTQPAGVCISFWYKLDCTCGWWAPPLASTLISLIVPCGIACPGINFQDSGHLSSTGYGKEKAEAWGQGTKAPHAAAPPPIPVSSDKEAEMAELWDLLVWVEALEKEVAEREPGKGDGEEASSAVSDSIAPKKVNKIWTWQ